MATLKLSRIISHCESILVILFLILQVPNSTLSSSIQFVSDSQYEPIIRNTQLNLNTKTWTISSQLCLKSYESPYCSCNSSHPFKVTIVCSCENLPANEVVRLSGSRDSNYVFEKQTTFKIEKCSKVIFSSGAFSALQGPLVELIIDNVQEAEISDQAFDLATGSSTPVSRSIIFKDVQISSILPHTFPSNLERIEFINSKVEMISTQSFRANSIKNVLFENSTIGTLDFNSFTENVQINSWLVKNSRFQTIKSHAIASSIGSMSWINSYLGLMKSLPMTGTIANVTFLGNTIGVVETNGLNINQWTWITLLNNTFHYVNESGIDLTRFAITNYNITEINGNVWNSVAPDFIMVGRTDLQVAIVLNNKFAEKCDCTKPFLSQVTFQKSSSWFLEKFRNNSHCSTTSKGASCLHQQDHSISYGQWEQFCSESVRQCMTELKKANNDDISYIERLPASKIRILVILIGATAIIIVACLIGVMCVYCCRSRRAPRSKLNGCAAMTIHKSASCSPPHSYVDLMPNSKISHMSLCRPTRPHSTLIDESLEMEDKGVQTMPNELCNDVIEELRGKLSQPDSFWDAKEKIDHLYDLIQVKPFKSPTSPTALPSTPDVAMCNTGNTPSSKFNEPTSQKESATTPTNGKQFQFPRYAQVKGKPKTAPICEYGDPSDSQMHIYSELNQMSIQNPILQNNNDMDGMEQRTNRPVLCEYTEPKDVRTHVYAELENCLNNDPAIRPRTMYRLPAQYQTPQHESNHFLSLSSSQMRPLPSIPSSSTIV